MNNLIKLCLLIFWFLISNSSAQNFFPLEITNKYQIFEQYFGSDGTYVWWVDTWKDYKILDDSIIAGKKYFRFSEVSGQPFSNDQYFYYNELEQKLYTKLPNDDTIRLAVDFNAAAGDTIISYIKGSPLPFVSQGISNYYLFGDSVLAFEISYNKPTSPFNKYTYVFAEEVGICFYYKSTNSTGFHETITQDLKCAIIDTTFYNPIYLNIIEVYPLENRPVNSFPFTLICAYQTNINLFDDFIVDILQVRGQDTIGTFNYHSVNHENYKLIPLLPQAGDKLLIRAAITDYSIFQNYDVYPDTGYAEILVLPSTVNVEDFNSPSVFNLYQNYPNPFNPSTNIQYSIPERSFVSLIIYDAMGNEIARPVNEEKNPGVYNYQFDGTNLASGVYFYKLSTNNYLAVKKMILLQ